MSHRSTGEILKRFILGLFLRVLLLATLTTGTSVHVLAQAVAVAEVTGYVSDSVGMSIPGATVTMVETGKHEVHTVTTDARTGRYSFTNLAVGTYDLTVSQTGFQKYVQSGIVLQVANNIDINVSLQVGAVALSRLDRSRQRNGGSPAVYESGWNREGFCRQSLCAQQSVGRLMGSWTER